MHQHARETDDTGICGLIVEQEASDDTGAVEIPLILAG